MAIKGLNGAEFKPAKEKNVHSSNVTCIEFTGKLNSYHDLPSVHLDWHWPPQHREWGLSAQKAWEITAETREVTGKQVTWCSPS